MRWKNLLIVLIILFFISSPAKADLISPVMFSQFGLIFPGGPLIAVGIIIVDWLANFILLSLILYLIKFNVKREWKKIVLASIIGLIGGLIADFFGMFGGIFLFFIGTFVISFVILYYLYGWISRHILKIGKKKIMTVAVFMAFFTNPLWFTFINASLFYPENNPFYRRRSPVVQVLSADCTDGKITLIVTNQGNVEINELNVLVNGTDKTSEFSDLIPIKPDETTVGTGESIYSGSLYINVIGPINAVPVTIWC